MKKIIALISLIAFSLLLFACHKNVVAVLDEIKTFEVSSEIHSLNIRINAADFKLKNGDKFSVESNLKFLSVSDKDGVLTIVDEAEDSSNYENAKLTVYIPSNTVFKSVDIMTGAAEMAFDSLCADSLQLKLGAGDVCFDSLIATSNISIEGGAGVISVLSGTLNNLNLGVGVGECNLNAAILGESNLTLGTGESNLKLLGGKENYKLDIKKGLGDISVDGLRVTDFDSIGNGASHITLEGGLGSIKIEFPA